MSAPSPPPILRCDAEVRRQWLSVLARSSREALERHAAPLARRHPGQWLRPPENGLVMLRGRIGNTGDRFNLGEATVTRCALTLCGPDGHASVGVGYVLGRDAERAHWIACVDACLQQPAWQADVWRQVIAPLQAQTAERHARERAAVAPSRVEFFTLHPEVS